MESVDRDELLGEIVDGLGPPWWRPFKRRSLRRLVSATSGPGHWSSLTADAEFVSMVMTVAERRAELMSDELPDGYRFTFGAAASKQQPDVTGSIDTPAVWEQIDRFS